MAKPKTQTKETSHTEGEKTAIQTLLAMPTFKCVGMAKIDGTNRWVSYVITAKGKSILSIEAGEPELFEVAESAAKTAFVHQFMDANL